MKNLTKKTLAYLAFLLIIIVFSITMLTNYSIINTKAEDDNITIEKKCEEYTNSDNLMNSDISIQELCSQIMANDSHGQIVSELPMMIPVEYLRNNFEDKTYYYMGKEYGFLVVHSSRISNNQDSKGYFWVYVIDFYLDGKDNTYVSKATPILNREFEYLCSKDGVETWRTVFGQSINDFNVVNVGFDFIILNENSLNYGDEGYDKYSDEGVIIQQSSINYSGLKQYNGGSFADVLKFVIDKGLGMIPIAKYYYSAYKDIKEISSIMQSFIEDVQQVVCSEPTNLFTEQSKEAQKTNTNIQSYSRVVTLSPSEDIYLDVGGYASASILLNDTNQRTRILQRITFEIVSKNVLGEFTYYNFDENGERAKFVAYKEDVEFGNENKEIQIGEDFAAYLLSNGNETVQFYTKSNGKFEIVPPANVNLSFELVDYLTNESISLIEENGVYSAILENNYANNGRYVLKVISNESEALGMINLQVRFAPPILTAGENSVTFYNSQKEYFKLPNDFACYNNVVCEGATITFYDKDFYVVGSASVGENRIESGQAVYCSISFENVYTGIVNVTYTREREIGYVTETTEPVFETINCDSKITLLVPTLSKGV